MDNWMQRIDKQEENCYQYPEEAKELLKLAFWSANKKYLDFNSCLEFVEDIFDGISNSDIRFIFEIIEEEFLYIHEQIQINQEQKENEQKIQNQMLKLGNALFRKVSRSQDMDIRGRLRVFLTKILPLCHISGRNKKQDINLNNNTIIQDQNEQQTEQQAEEVENDKKQVLDVNLKDDNLFDQQQNMEQEKEKSEQKEKDKEKNNKANKNEKEDKVQKSVKLLAICNLVQQIIQIFKDNRITESGNTASIRYPKYLTNKSLLEIQFKDPLFRKTILVQAHFFFNNLIDKKMQEFSKEGQDVINQTIQKVKESLANESKNLKESNLSQQIKDFIIQDKTWEEWKNIWQQQKQQDLMDDKKFLPREHQQIIEALKQQEQIYEQNELVKFETQRNLWNEPINNYSQNSCLELVNTLKQLKDFRKGKKIKEIPDSDSSISFIFKPQGYKYSVPTQSLENLPSCYLNQAIKSREFEDSEATSYVSKDSFAWKTLRRVSRFDISLFNQKESKKEQKKLNFSLENIAEKTQQNYFAYLAQKNENNSNGINKKRSPSMEKDFQMKEQDLTSGKQIKV
ncbi:hypothetical protein PPERSA_06099 [Pseudocohnilembus persalinus]|uniref:Uncharacterized protein n=1 Tax=Pseudocohnilembus persalinus TaxID=266149 RepID=A0A0V0QV14_PSEPJ|nr:hypothetical protein PPERSA_06099 [Pseudocohnilembus persalinus]|eukprot:KRX06217.1 hypothetical protein PPERSA_06099 [Pseudocohnilembus persalinus]